MIRATQQHLDIGYKLLKHIWITKHLLLTFNGALGIDFYVMVDSSYASHADRKSQYRVSVHMNSYSVSCISVSKKDQFWLYLPQKLNIYEPCMKPLK
jgi:hypothetical protein